MLDKPSMNFLDLITANAANNPGKTAIVTDQGRVTWAEFEQTTNRIANAIISAGLVGGDKVAALIGNSAEGVLLFFGTLKAGAVYVPVSTFLSSEQVASIVGNSDAKLFIVSHQFRDVAETIRRDLANVCACLLYTSPSPRD